MNLERYEIDCDSLNLEYSFFSIGKNGDVKKVARFSESNVKGIYQFSFGDWNEKTGTINENVKTNNLDANKVINTIAYILYDFVNRFPQCLVRVSGSSRSRTRFFLIWLIKNRIEVNKCFIVFGCKMSEQWERYKTNGRYGALIFKKR